jgi:hypothetical protein
VIELIRPPKYLPGYKFWVPRCRKHWKEETTVIDGITWNREWEEFGAYAKQKVILSASISINAKHQIIYSYRIADIKDRFEQGISTYVEEDNMEAYSTEEEALVEARKYEKRGEEYFGFKHS